MRCSKDYVSTEITLRLIFRRFNFCHWVRLQKLDPCENYRLYCMLDKWKTADKSDIVDVE